MDTVLTEPPATPTVEPSPEAERWLRPPTFEEAHGVWLRYHQTPVEVIDPDLSHCGQFVAFFDGKPWGYDPDPTALRERVEASLNAHRNWVVISYLG
jgi:hypothetical protein